MGVRFLDTFLRDPGAICARLHSVTDVSLMAV